MLCPAYFRCDPHPTHLIQMMSWSSSNSSESGVLKEKYLKHAGQGISGLQTDKHRITGTWFHWNFLFNKIKIIIVRALLLTFRHNLIHGVVYMDQISWKCPSWMDKVVWVKIPPAQSNFCSNMIALCLQWSWVQHLGGTKWKSGVMLCVLWIRLQSLLVLLVQTVLLIGPSLFLSYPSPPLPPQNAWSWPTVLQLLWLCSRCSM